MPIKFLFVIVIMFATMIAKCQVKDFRLDGFQGAIFSKNEIMTIEDSISRWNPTQRETEQVMKILNDFLKEEFESGNLMNQGFDNCPVIYKKRKRYFYQIFGTKNGKDEDIIHVNAIWKSPGMKNKYNKQYVGILDGCSHYWSLDVNHKTGNVTNFVINGVG